jgi:hypothetical protein
MNHPKSPNSQLLQFMLRAQQLARQDVKTDKGYAMMMTSIITIMLFSLMGAFLTMTNLAKSSTDAYIDGNNTFYASESALNRRAQELRARFENYNSPSDGATTLAERAETNRKPTTMSACYTATTAPSPISDFECRNYTFTYNNNIARTAGTNGDSIVLSEADGNSSKVEYKAFTFVSDKTDYNNASSVREPTPTVIASGTYAGLNAQEYKYTVNATATKPNANVSGSQIGQSGENKTVLQMDFKSRTIPLFQFGAFYTRNLELNPSPQMRFNGRLHSNQNIYLSAGNTTDLTLNGIISAVTSINTGNPSLPNGYRAGGTVQIQTDPTNTTALANLPANSNPTETADPVITSTSTPAQVTTVKSTYSDKLKIAATALTPPPIGFLTKADTTRADGIGEYYGKADLRLEMFPDRSVPFKLQVVKGGTTASTTCTVAPFSTTTKISNERAGYNTAECKDLNEGQLRSLMQPVLVRPRSTIEYTTFCTTPPGEVRTPPQVGTAPAIGTTDIKDNSTDPIKLAIKERILDALYLTLAAQTTTVSYSTLATPLSADAQVQFKELLGIINIPGITASDLSTLAGQAPRDIAALSSTTTKDNTIKGSCFRPAPIQALFNPTTVSAGLSANTLTNFNDRRENRYIRMLQTNIESLTLWNRDGLFVPGSDPTFATNVAALAGNFMIAPSTKEWDSDRQKSSSGNEILFKRAAAVTTALVYNPTTKTYEDITLAANLFRTMGLAASDRTEGGLVFHATIDKTAYSYTTRQSPYGFAFNDGANLPAPLTIATDQAVYTQGDWNNVDKQPASFLADTIAILSNSCLNTTGDAPATANLPASLMGQLNCGSIAGRPTTAATTTVNAAFLSRTDDSTATYYSGGLNNYMRILEDWVGRTMNYTGSFISLGAPQEVSGQYRACNLGSPTTNYACPPTRNWDYDTSFNSYNGLPPLPPKVTELQQDSFRRKYN